MTSVLAHPMTRGWWSSGTGKKNDGPATYFIDGGLASAVSFL